MPRRESAAPSPAKAAIASASNANAKSPAKAAEKTPIKTAEKADEKKKGNEKVEIVKDASGLGLSIVGGSDTPLVSNIERTPDKQNQ